MLLLLIVLCPVVAAILIMAGLPARPIAVLAAFANFFMALTAWILFDSGSAEFQYVSSFAVSIDWKINFAIGLDGLSLLMVLLAAIVTVGAVWFSGKIDKYENAFFACLLLISGGAIGAFASLDLFFFYAFHELALIPTFLLIGIWGNDNRTAAAWKITIYLALGSFILLIGLIMLYQSIPVAARSFDIRTLQAAASQIGPGAQRNIYLVLLVGFGILVSLFPFHTWAPDAYAAAPAPAAMLHAGVLKKFGLYGLLRIAVPMLPEGARYWTNLLLVLLLANIIYIGLATLAQRRLDRMLGYSSVMHMGYIFLGIASMNLLGLTGAAILMFAHGLSIALLFAIAGEVRARTKTMLFSELGGLAQVMPFAGLAFGFGAFAAIGLPGLANFGGEILIFFGAFRNGFTVGNFHVFQVATVLALWGVVISAVYMLRAYRQVFMGTMDERWKDFADLRSGLRFPIVLLVGGLIWFGFYPQPLVRMLSAIFQTYLQQPP